MDHLDILFNYILSEERRLVGLTTFGSISHEPFIMERSTGVRLMTHLITL